MQEPNINNKQKNMIDSPIPKKLKYLQALPPEQRVISAFGITEEQLALNEAGKFTMSQMFRLLIGQIIIAMVLMLIGLIPIFLYFSDDPMPLVLGIALVLMMYTIGIGLLFHAVSSIRLGVQHITGMVNPDSQTTKYDGRNSATSYFVEIEDEKYIMTAKQLHGFIGGQVYHINFAPNTLAFLNYRGQVISARYIENHEN